MNVIDIVLITLISVITLGLMVYFFYRLKNKKGLEDCPNKDDLKIMMKVYKHNKKKKLKKQQKAMKHLNKNEN